MNQELLSPDAVRSLFTKLRPAVVTIDGPAASGKSTVGYQLAERIHYLFFDTGIMYRAVTWIALARGINIHDESAISQLAEKLEIDVVAPSLAEQDGRQNTVLADGQDITWHLRTPAVDQNVSIVSAYSAVRHALSAQQRCIGQRYGAGNAEKAGVVMVGRDIGSVVLPEAALKIYMEASPQERARRRFRERLAQGRPANYDEILQDLVRRDELDSARSHSPMRPADDAFVLDTSALAPDEVVAKIIALADQVLS